MSTVAVKPLPKPKPRTKPSVAHHSEEERNLDSSGNYLTADIREDELQLEKLAEIIEILVAAGYFRARIKGLSDFDKIVGGMCWCLEMSNIDIDCDLLFNDSLTIGQKIALTEKIVRVLQAMECPFRLEPHQIQGMDAIHIFPVIQWLVKKTIQYREEMQAYIKSYAVNQFSKCHANVSETDTKMDKIIEDVDVYNNPKRKYRHPAKHKMREEKISVRTTLLEYGGAFFNEMKSEKLDSEKGSGKSTEKEEPKALINEMNVESSVRVSSAIVGSIISDKAEEIQVLADEYARRQKEFMENNLEMRESNVKLQISEKKKSLEQCQKEIEIDKEKLNKLRSEIEDLRMQQKEVNPKISLQNDEEIEKRRKLIFILDTLNSQKEEFLVSCREEKARLQEEFLQLSQQEVESEDENEIKSQVEKDKERHQKIKLLLAERSKTLAAMQRKLDDIPSRSELSQYQKRFYELYNQVSAKHNETKKFYILYNQCDDTKIHLNKELNLLNSVLTNFNQAVINPSTKEQFVTQFEQIVGNIRQAKLQ
ncbi:coiled-coil domain-containing protein 93-like protein, partial [Leptotrombidium deliense]